MPAAARQPTDQPSEGRSYRGRSAAERREDRRHQLVETGLELFGTLGYQKTSIERVCSTARVAPRHFYEEFSTREALLVAVYEEANRRVADAVATARARVGGEIEGAIRSYLDAAVHAMVDDPRVARIILIEVAGVSPEFEQRRRDSLNEYLDLVEQEAAGLAAAGLWSFRRDIRLGSMALLGATNELVLELLINRDTTALDDVVDVLVEVWTSVVLGALDVDSGERRPAS